MTLTCPLCPFRCELRPGQTGRCRVRKATHDGIVYEHFGRVKPLKRAPTEIHFMQWHPGATVVTAGGPGCVLACRHCHNDRLSQSADLGVSYALNPEQVPALIEREQAVGMLWTYNDPIVAAEYVQYVNQVVQSSGHLVAVCTSGFINPDVLPNFFANVDAIDFGVKGFGANTSQALTRSDASVALNAIVYAIMAGIHVEVTWVMVPGFTDDQKEIQEFAMWLRDLDVNIPFKLARFQPAHLLVDLPHTSMDKLARAYDAVTSVGLKYVYLGNVANPLRQTTYCQRCNAQLIMRTWFEIHEYHMDGAKCTVCGARQHGEFPAEPPVQRLTMAEDIEDGQIAPIG